MSEHTWATNDVPPASQFDEDLHKQTVIRCTSTSRGATWAGKHIYETDTGLRRHWDGTRWLTHPHGIIAQSTITTSAPITGIVGLPNSELTFQTVTDERYVYELDFVFQMLDAGTTLTVQPQLDHGSGYADFGVHRDYDSMIASHLVPVSFREQWQATTTGTAKFRTLVSRVGTGWAVVDGGSDCMVLHQGNWP